jgi:hypothetical protein
VPSTPMAPARKAACDRYPSGLERLPGQPPPTFEADISDNAQF